MADDSWHQQESFKSMFTFGSEGLKFIALINGGGAVAVVAYGLGKLPAHTLFWPMTFFLSGTFSVAAAYCFAYLTQLALYGESAELGSHGLRGHGKYLAVAVTCAFLSLFSFGGACFAVVRIINKL